MAKSMIVATLVYNNLPRVAGQLADRADAIVRKAAFDIEARANGRSVMALMRAAVVTPWIGTGTDSDPFRPQVAEQYGVGFVDVTGHPADSIPAISTCTIGETGR